MLVVVLYLLSTSQPPTIKTEGGNVQVAIGAGNGFAVVCPPIVYGEKLACEGPDVDDSNGKCQPKVAGCVGGSVEVDANGNCVAKVDKYIEAYLDTVSSKLQADADAMTVEVKLFKTCAAKNALFVGTDAADADADGCGAIVADNEAVTKGLEKVTATVKDLVDKDVASVRAESAKATTGIAALNKGILKCGEQNKLLLGDADEADKDGCGEELLAVANQSASVTVLDAYPKTMDCKDDFGVGEIAIIQIEGKTELLLICDGTKFVLFSSTGSVKNFKYTGNTQQYTVGTQRATAVSISAVPFPITEIEVHAYGAGGGTGLASDKNKRSRGGAGGYATAKVEVQPGDSFKIIVGQGGRSGTIAPNGNSFGGGGQGQWWSNSGYWGGNGGGLSGIFKTDEVFAKPKWQHNSVGWSQGALRKGPASFDWAGYHKTAVVVAAGGGGGGGGPWDTSSGAHGGAGGGKVGGNGLDGNHGVSTGGTQSAGGASAYGPGQSHAAGNTFGRIMWPFGWQLHGGTDWPRAVGSWSRQYGGGGGGGYFGGGHGAYNNGGGGGSSFVHDDATDAKLVVGTHKDCKAISGGAGTKNYPGGGVGAGGPSHHGGCKAASGGNGHLVIIESY